MGIQSCFAWKPQWLYQFFNFLGNVFPLSASDVGDQCPKPLFHYGDSCCCQANCCLDNCTISTPPNECLQNIPNSEWIFLKQLGYFRAIGGKEVLNKTDKHYKDLQRYTQSGLIRNALIRNH